MLPIKYNSPRDIQLCLGRKAKALRLYRGWKQETLARKAGVSLGTVKNMERGENVSLHNFLRIAHALGRIGRMEEMFELPGPGSIDEMDRRQSGLPARGRR